MSVPYPSCALNIPLIENGTHPLAMTPIQFPFLLPFLLAYFFAGLQTWRLLLAMEMGRDDALAVALRRGDAAVWPIFLVFMLAWPLFIAASWLATRLFAEPLPQQES